jgi:hypothetical protein
VAVMEIAGGLGASATAEECKIGMVEFNALLRPYVLELKEFQAGKGNRSWIWELFSRRHKCCLQRGHRLLDRMTKHQHRKQVYDEYRVYVYTLLHA